MQQEKNILVNRGIPRTLSLPNHGFGSNWDHSTVTINADLGRDGFDVATDWVNDGNLHTEKTYRENIKNIVRITDAELVNTRTVVRATAKGGTDALALELNALSLLLSSITTEHQKQITTANLFYGHDPLTHKGRDPYMKGFDVPYRISEKNYIKAAEKWNVSYAAAYHAKFLAEQMKLLNASIATQNRAIADANARAAAAAQAKAQAEAKRVAAEAARKAADAEAKRAAEERARLAAEAQRLAAAEKAATLAKAQAEAKRAAEEQARKEAEAEAKRAAEEQARRAAEAQRLAAAEKATAQAKAQAEAKRLAAEEARKATEAEIRRMAEVQALRQALSGRSFPMLGAAAGAGPVFAIAGSTLATSPATTLAIQAALRTAITMVVESASAVAAPALTGFAALFYSSELGNGDLYALSVPLSELIPDKSDNLHAIATAQGEINLPLAIGSRTMGNKTEYVVTTTHSAPTLSKAYVQLATLDSLGNFYRSGSPDDASSNIIWTPIVKPNGASTSLPASVPNMVPYTGATPEAVAGRIDTHPEFDLYSFGGFVTVFPPESGIPPIYTVINSPYEGATAKGEHSGRDFNPEQAGGPILELDWRAATVTQEGLDAVKLHIARLDQSDANVVMIERLERILSGEMNASDVDKRFYTHETRELERFRAQGLADDFIPSDGSAEWNNAHTATLEDYKLSSNESLLYSSEALEAGRKQLEEIYKRLLKGEF